jgi:hypothetical protein
VWAGYPRCLAATVAFSLISSAAAVWVSRPPVRRCPDGRHEFLQRPSSCPAAAVGRPHGRQSRLRLRAGRGGLRRAGMLTTLPSLVVWRRQAAMVPAVLRPAAHAYALQGARS